LSPLPPVPTVPEKASPVPPPPAQRRFHRWQRWAVAGFLVLAILTGIALGVHLRVRSSGPALFVSSPDVVVQIRAQVSAARKSLREGNFQMAAQELGEAVGARERHA